MVAVVMRVFAVAEAVVVVVVDAGAAAEVAGKIPG